jgi:hypothetical protein
MGERPGLDANIQPLKTWTGACLARCSTTSRNAADSGGSSGGCFSQTAALISNVPKRTISPTGACKVITRAVTLSRARNSTIEWVSAEAGQTAVANTNGPTAPALSNCSPSLLASGRITDHLIELINDGHIGRIRTLIPPPPSTPRQRNSQERGQARVAKLSAPKPPLCGSQLDTCPQFIAAVVNRRSLSICPLCRLQEI